MDEGDHATEGETTRVRRRLSTQPQLPVHYSGLADEWYCVMAVCGAPSAAADQDAASGPASQPSAAKRQRTEEASEGEGATGRGPGAPGASASTRRTAVYHTTDPIGYVCKLNGDPLLPFDADAVEWYNSQKRKLEQRNTSYGLASAEALPATTPAPPLLSHANLKRKAGSHGGASRYRIVFVIGPLPSQNSAIIVQTLLLWRSRGLVPRTAWGKLIAEHFYAHFWVNYEEVFPMKHHTIAHNELGEVYIKEKIN